MKFFAVAFSPPFRMARDRRITLMCGLNSGRTLDNRRLKIVWLQMAFISEQRPLLLLLSHPLSALIPHS